MAHVIFRAGASLQGVKKVILVTPRGSGLKSTGPQVKTLFVSRARDDDDLDDGDIRVRIIRPFSGVVREGEIDDSGPRRRKQSKPLRPFERAVRKLVRRQLAIGQVYLARHDRSNRTRRDGWIKDLRKNIARAIRQTR